MTQSVAVSARSVLIAGLSAAVVGAAVVTPNVPAVSEAKITAIATQLTSATTPIEDAIKNTYDAVEPWAAWGAALGQWALGFVPGLWWVAPGISLAYYTAEPLVQAGVYTFADVIGLDFAQIGPDITTGINQSLNNAVTYGLAWLNSLVPLPPFPPFPPRPGAAVAPDAALAAAATTVVAGPTAKSITTPIEVAIKNTYNAVEPWVAYGMQWVDYVAGLIPVVNWFSPAIPLAYYTIEPLVRAGTYATADLIGLNFAAIWPDIWNGITTSSTNFVNGILNWANIPVPPPLPGAAVGAPAAGLPAAAAAAPVEVAAPEVPAATGAETDNARKSDDNAAAPARDAAAPAVTAAESAAPAAPAPGDIPTDTVAPETESEPALEPVAPVADVTPPVVESAAADAGIREATAPTAHRGPRGSAATGDSDSSGAPAKAGRHARG